jgi:hypothetical protein
MIESILSLSPAGLILVTIYLLIAFFNLTLVMKDSQTLKFRLFSFFVLAPIYLSIVLYGDWLIFVSYFLITGAIMHMIPDHWQIKGETLENLQEVKENGLYGCMVVITQIISFLISCGMFALFQWVR